MTARGRTTRSIIVSNLRVERAAFTGTLLAALGLLSSLPLLAQSVIVNDAGDSVHACAVSGTGACSLRDAILYANATPGTSIQFNIPGNGVHTISPATALPVITAPTTIDGYTQPGSGMNDLPIRGRTAAVLLIELDGSVENGSTTGVGLQIGSGVTSWEQTSQARRHMPTAQAFVSRAAVPTWSEDRSR